MIAAGIDVGGTKIEAQIFDAAWHCADKLRFETPNKYDQLVEVICQAIEWADTQGSDLPIGVGAAGLIARETGHAITANLPAFGKPLPMDIGKAAGRYVTYVNDCRAFTLSEAVFGSAKGYKRIVGLILGTGTGGGVAYEGKLLSHGAGVGGEFGHIFAPAHLVQKYDLPIVTCGCGKVGCIETLVSGPGMTRLAEAMTGRAIKPRDIDQLRDTDGDVAKVWEAWCALVSELCLAIDYTINPDVIVLGGGLSTMKQVIRDLSAQMAQNQFDGFQPPLLLSAEGGGSSGARGAAYAAWQDRCRD